MSTKISCGGFYIDDETLSLSDDNKLSVKNSGGGSEVLIVNPIINTDNIISLDKTWKEIHDAVPLVWMDDDGAFLPLTACWEESGDYGVTFVEFGDVMNRFREYYTDSENGYPVLVINPNPDGPEQN